LKLSLICQAFKIKWGKKQPHDKQTRYQKLSHGNPSAVAPV